MINEEVLESKLGTSKWFSGSVARTDLCIQMGRPYQSAEYTLELEKKRLGLNLQSLKLKHLPLQT